MTFPQSKLENWARQMGETHGEWITDVVARAYEAGYVEAYPHAAKHTMEKVFEIIDDLLVSKSAVNWPKSVGVLAFASELKFALKDKNNW